MVDHPFIDKHASVRLSFSFPQHLFVLITQEALHNRKRVSTELLYQMASEKLI